jgi:hypothetical protein
MNERLEVDGCTIRKVVRPSNLFLNIFKGKKIAKCINEEWAKALVYAHNQSLINKK